MTLSLSFLLKIDFFGFYETVYMCCTTKRKHCLFFDVDYIAFSLLEINVSNHSLVKNCSHFSTESEKNEHSVIFIDDKIQVSAHAESPLEKLDYEKSCLSFTIVSASSPAIACSITQPCQKLKILEKLWTCSVLHADA